MSKPIPPRTVSQVIKRAAAGVVPKNISRDLKIGVSTVNKILRESA